MLRRLARVISVVLAGGAVAWWARLKAHGKVPPPEGRWREVAEDDLS